jgi:hypothetical protein
MRAHPPPLFFRLLQVIYVTAPTPVVYTEPYYTSRYYRHSRGHQGMAVVGIIAAIIAW